MEVLEKINSQFGQIAILIDPEKVKNIKSLITLVNKINLAAADFIFIGGSTVSRDEFTKAIEIVKAHTQIPIVIFPGSNIQLSNKANALLYLSLVSGRNPDYLIGQHIESAEDVLNLRIEVLPTAYILVDGERPSSVAYVSQTSPIPRSQTNIAVKTALAATLQGKKIVFLDAGSGAKKSVPFEMINALKQKVACPIIVGGGIKDIQTIEKYKDLKVNVIVIGNKIEEDVDFLLDLKNFKQLQN